MSKEISMDFQQGYDERAFCEDVISNWSVTQPELLEWKEEVHNSMAILAEGIRNQSIDASEVFDFLESILSRLDAISEIENAIAISFIEFNELTNLGLVEKVTPLVKEVLKKQHERWQNYA